MADRGGLGVAIEIQAGGASEKPLEREGSQFSNTHSCVRKCAMMCNQSIHQSIHPSIQVDDSLERRQRGGRNKVTLTAPLSLIGNC
jgi:hypothetical protein